MHKEGLGLLLGFGLAALVLTMSHRMIGGGPFLRVIEAMLWLGAGFVLFFFRDPERRAPAAPGVVVSPADGTVVEIVDVLEPEYLKIRARRISIFLSPFNVHVNRSPIEGEVKYYRYRQGKFLRAFLPAASTENEQSIIGMEGPWGKITFKQIAGIIARRIVCDAQEGRKLKVGERFGIIKFGSRMDVFLPLDAPLKVRVRDKVTAGESVLGELSHGS